jgi:hypothetical protein
MAVGRDAQTRVVVLVIARRHVVAVDNNVSCGYGGEGTIAAR